MSSGQTPPKKTAFGAPSEAHHSVLHGQGGVTGGGGSDAVQHDRPEKDRPTIPDSATESLDQAGSQDEACPASHDILDIGSALEFPSLSTSTKVSHLTKRERKERTAEMLQSEPSNRSTAGLALESDDASDSSLDSHTETPPSSSGGSDVTPTYAVAISGESSASGPKDVPKIWTATPLGISEGRLLPPVPIRPAGQDTAQPPFGPPTAAIMPRTPDPQFVVPQKTPRGLADPPSSAKKSLNVDSPSFTPTQLQQGAKKHTFSSQTANAAVFTPKAVATSKLVHVPLAG